MSKFGHRSGTQAKAAIQQQIAAFIGGRTISLTALNAIGSTGYESNDSIVHGLAREEGPRHEQTDPLSKDT